MDIQAAKWRARALGRVEEQRRGKVKAIQTYCDRWYGCCGAGTAAESTDMAHHACVSGI